MLHLELWLFPLGMIRVSGRQLQCLVTSSWGETALIKELHLLMATTVISSLTIECLNKPQKLGPLSFSILGPGNDVEIK